MWMDGVAVLIYMRIYSYTCTGWTELQEMHGRLSSWLPGVVRSFNSQRRHALQDAPAPNLAPGLSCLSGAWFLLFLRWLRFTGAEGGEGVCMWRRPTGHRGWAAVSGKTRVTTLLWRREKQAKTWPEQ